MAGGGNHSLFLKNDGTVWAVGWNFFGQLGDGTINNKSTPVQIHGVCGITSSTAENNITPAISVYPNPTAGKFHLATSNQYLVKDTQVHIYNVFGKLVYENSFLFGQNQNEVVIDLSQQPKGIYFLEVEGEMGSKKIIVQ